MKKIKNLLFILLISLIVPTGVIYASTNLTIDNKSYNENTQIFTVSGTSSYSDVMVSLFEGEELLSFKTVTTANNNYNATFNIIFSEDKTITIKVGDINSTNYKMTTLDVKKTIGPVKPSKLTDDGDNSLTILDSLNKFETDDELLIDIQVGFNDLSEEEKNLLNFAQKKLGEKKKLVGVLNVRVINGRHQDINLKETTKGYELFLNVNKDDLKDYKKPCMVRVIDDQEMEFEDYDIVLEYNSDKKGIVSKLNNIGTYLLYDDISIDYEFLDKTEDQTYNQKNDDTLTIRIDADYSKFLDVYVDEKLVDKKNYTSKSGSTIIIFNKDYLQTLKAGTHNVRVNFTDGEANTTITIDNTANPKTGDNIIYYIILCLVSISGIYMVVRFSKEKI